jgi:hypothetical protein
MRLASAGCTRTKIIEKRLALVGLATLIRAGRVELIDAPAVIANSVIPHRGSEEEEEGPVMDLLSVEMPINAVDAIAYLTDALGGWGMGGSRPRRTRDFWERPELNQHRC